MSLFVVFFKVFLVLQPILWTGNGVFKNRVKGIQKSFFLVKKVFRGGIGFFSIRVVIVFYGRNKKVIMRIEKILFLCGFYK